MHSSLLQRLTAASLLAVPALASAALPAGLSGSWYSPTHSGTGFSVQMLSDTRALVFWYSTDPHGHPFNVYVEATVDGRSLVGRGLAPRGLRFGEWHRDDLRVPAWGDVRIHFNDCDNAHVSWTPNSEAGAGFAPGSAPLRRLTHIEGNACAFPANDDVPGAQS